MKIAWKTENIEISSLLIQLFHHSRGQKKLVKVNHTDYDVKKIKQ